jgi:long-chain acyl-CoA synthetase
MLTMPLVTGLRDTRHRSPDKLAVICGDQSWTYAEFDRLTDFVAGRLLCAGIRPGERIAFHLLNVSELALGYVGCLKAGAIAVPVNTRLKAREIEYVLRHSGAACYIGQPDLYSEVVGLQKQLSELRRLYLIGNGSSVDGVRPFEELLQPLPEPVSLPAFAAGQAAAILYTSGTTAHPKGVTHSHETLAQTARSMRGLQVDENQVVIVITLMAHIVAFGMLFLGSLLNGATVVLLPRIEPQSVLQAFQRHRCSCTLGLPTRFHALALAQSATPHDVSSGRFYFCGGDSGFTRAPRGIRARYGPERA